MVVKKGDKVKVKYEGTLEDGSIFDSSENHEGPLEFEVGSGLLMEAFENEVIDMDVGDKKEFTLQPTEAYGEYNDELKKDVPKDQFPDSEKVEKGMMLVLNLPNGIQLPAQIIEVADESITIDLNHPLAGKVLNFKIELVEILT
jgi:FKBP-type peptidyl-prolyl cis-trans isomerase 2